MNFWTDLATEMSVTLVVESGMSVEASALTVAMPAFSRASQIGAKVSALH